MVSSEVARKVGAFVLALVAAATVFFVFVFDRIDWGSRVRIHVYFHQTGGLVEGAPFVVAGRAVGRVESIADVPHGMHTPLGGDEGVVATVAIDRGIASRLAIGDVFVASRGPLSGKYLELGPAADGAPRLHEGSELLGRDPPSLDRVLQRTWDNLTTLGRFGADLREPLDALRAQLDELRRHLDEVTPPDVTLRADLVALVAEATRTYDLLGGRDGLDRIGAVAGDARVTVAQARTMIAALRTRADALSASLTALRGRLDTRGQAILDRVALALDRARDAMAKIDPLLAQIDELNAAIARGEGSMMKLMNDPEFPEDAKELGKILKRHPWRVLDDHPKP